MALKSSALTASAGPKISSGKLSATVKIRGKAIRDAWSNLQPPTLENNVETHRKGARR